MDLPVPSVGEVHRLLRSLQENLDCPICLDLMKEPVSTICGHIFCRFCILKLLDQRKYTTLCPLCSAKITKRSLRADICVKEIIRRVLETIRAFERDIGVKYSDDLCHPKKVIEVASASSTSQENLIVNSVGYRDRSNYMKKEEKRNTDLGNDFNLQQYRVNERTNFLRKKSYPSNTIVWEIDKEHNGSRRTEDFRPLPSMGSASSEVTFQEENMIKCFTFESSSSSLVDKDCIMNQSQRSCHIEHTGKRAKNEPHLYIGAELMSCASEATTLEDSLGQFSQGEILNTQQRNAMQNNLKQLQQKMAIIEAVLKKGSQSVGSERGLPERERNYFKREQTETRIEMPYVLEKSVPPLAYTRTPSERNDLLLNEGQEMSLVASGLNKSELDLVHKFARKTKSNWSNRITEQTTHLIMKTDEDLVCDRTLKYFIGIAAKKWVLSYKWIIQSFETGRILNEEDFEVRGDKVTGKNHQGPKRARESPTRKIFQGMEICCYGPFTDMLPEQLEWIVELCGASIIKQPHLFEHATDFTAVIVVEPDAWTEEITCQKLPSDCIPTIVSCDWVLDSVSSYQCKPFKYYSIPKKLSSISK
ncbi:breast cancer type 1 susceptibility protein isoform X3 [Erythrolamprus reginae]|uniref:breast cancer type 1 susceptibility protein isoform X3 n=1 Tax=Erythrolamprus reginae TaxID=121349 RepID=UPI00396CE33A